MSRAIVNRMTSITAAFSGHSYTSTGQLPKFDDIVPGWLPSLPGASKVHPKTLSLPRSLQHGTYNISFIGVWDVQLQIQAVPERQDARRNVGIVLSMTVSLNWESLLWLSVRSLLFRGLHSLGPLILETPISLL